MTSETVHISGERGGTMMLTGCGDLTIPKKAIVDAVDELIGKVQAGALRDEPQWHNLASMPRLA